MVYPGLVHCLGVFQAWLAPHLWPYYVLLTCGCCPPQLDIFFNFLTGVVSYNLETGLQETNYSLTAVAADYAR